MGYRVKGTLKLPDGSPASNAEIEFISRKNYSPLVQELKSNMLCGPTGAYDITLELGEYAVIVYPGGTYPAALGTIILAADTVAGQDLPTLLQQAGWQPATPEYIQQIAQWLADANESASDALASELAAKASENNAKASELSAESDRAEVAVKSANVDVKHAEVVSKAAIVDTKTAQVVAAEYVAAAAADTASQKAASAATHDASAQDAATRAENAASAVVGAVLDGGECDLSTGVYPQPITVAGKKYSTVWYVAVAGSVSGVSFYVGDVLRYTTAKEGYYFKVDAKDDVYSVNGEKGAVTITPAKIGAEKVGIAQQLVEQHTAKQGAHSIVGVAGLEGVLTALTNRMEELERWPQSGSNANGRWIKYRDGTMICTMSKEVTGLTGTAYGSVYGNSQTRITYPKEFVGTPVVAPSSSIPPNITSWCTTNRPDNISAGVIIFSGTNISPADKFNIELIAVGRWK